MKLKRILPLLLSAAVLTAAVIGSAAVQNKQEVIVATSDEATPSEAVAEEEMRGVWISYMELSMENEEDKSEAAFKDKFERIASRCKSLGFNTLVVQVRPFCDALYKSDYFPYSHILTGIQGKNPHYDPLEIICEVCRAKKLKLHAWVNPYRVRSSQTPAEISGRTPSRGLTIETESGAILDPSNEKARKLIVNGVREIVQNYDVDGVQYDDYFYPEDFEDEDEEQYEEYKSCQQGDIMSIEAWRTLQVNLLISETYIAVHECKKDVVFGISPQGNLSNNAKLNADVESWCCVKGFVDYICPQLYFSLDNPALSFESALQQWKSLDFAEGVKLYAGLAGYKAGSDADEGTWKEADDILSREYSICQGETDGIILFDYDSLEADDSKKEINNLSRSFG